jgi:N-acetyl-anhydromuramyl-L-alanine amidase AmpD
MIKWFMGLLEKTQYLRLLRFPTDTKENVCNLQKTLNKNGSNLRIDGSYGRDTKREHERVLDILWVDFCKKNKIRYTQQAIHKSRSRVGMKINRVIWHWPSSGRSAESLGNLWINDSRQVSSHAGIDENGIIFYAPLHLVTFHAGKDNGDSIGIDICSPPLTDAASIHRSKTRGIYFEEKNGYQLLHPSVIKQIERCRDILAPLDLKYEDHAFVDPGRKIDCIPWREQLKQIGVYDE